MFFIDKIKFNNTLENKFFKFKRYQGVCVMRTVIAIVTFFSCFLSAEGVTSASLKYDLSASNGLIPYYNNNPDYPGIYPEFIHLVLQEANIKGIEVILPSKRTQVALARGELDFDIISPSWFTNHKIPNGYVLSVPLLTVTEHLIFLPGQAKSWLTLDAIKDRPVGTVRGYFYHDDYLFERVDLASEKELIMALDKRRINVAISGDLPALYWSQQLNIPIQLGPIHSTGFTHIRLREEHVNLLPALNKAIEKLQQQGVLDVIVQRYMQIVSKQQPLDSIMTQ